MKNTLKRNVKNEIIFFVPFLIFLLFLLIYYPGIITVDGNYQWRQVQSGLINNAHPFFSTYFMYILSKIWNNHLIIILFQILIFSSFWTFICSKTRNDNFKNQLLYTIFICFIPLISIFSITLWKDILYSYYLMILGFITYDIAKNRNYKFENFHLVELGILLFLIFSYRHNGMIVAILYLFIIIYMYLKHNKKNKLLDNIKKIGLMIIIFVGLILIISIPKKIYLDKSSKADDSINIGTLNQYMLWSFGTYLQNDIVDSKDIQFLDKVMDTKHWKKQYYPMCINSTFYPDKINEKFLLENQQQFRQIYIKYVSKKPYYLIKHVLTADSLLLSINSQNHGYVYSFAFYEWNDRLGYSLEKNSKLPKLGYYYDKIINFTLNSPLKYFYQPGLILYICIGLIVYFQIFKKFKKLYLLCMPMFLNTISLLPINLAQDLRYVYINYLTLLMLIVVIMGLLSKKYETISLKKEKQKKFKKILLIIPAYNEEENILKTCRMISNFNITNNKRYDIVVINDGSMDDTENILIKNKINHIKLVNNLGIGGAVQTGYKYALENDYDIAIQYDGDGQHDVRYVENLISPIINGNADFVIGSRFLKKDQDNFKSTFARRIGISIISFFIKLTTGKKIYDTTSGFRAGNKNIIREFANNYPTEYPEPITTVELLKKGYRVDEVYVKMNEREGGQSSINSWKSIYYMINVVLSVLVFGSRRYK